MQHTVSSASDAHSPLDLADNDTSFAPVLTDTDPTAIPDVVIRRLPVYVRTLQNLHAHQTLTVSSDELADHIGVTAAQIRRDLSYFGRFGKQGKGYDTGFLAERIAEILGLNTHWDVALAGVGNLGQAVLRYRGFSLPSSSFNIVAVFDRGAHGPKDRIDGIPILPTDRMTEVLLERQIRVGIIAVPAAAAQEIADRMIAGGVKALLNYAPVVLKVPDDVTVREIDPVSALQSMTYYLTER